MTTKRIIYTRNDGGLTVMVPCVGARLCHRLTFSDGRVLAGEDGPVTADHFARAWPVEGATPDWAETEDEFVARIAKKYVPADAINPTIVDASEIPTDRSYRNAWMQDGSAVVHDMEKARDIHKGRLRAARKPLLEALDVEITRAYKSPKLQDEIEAKRQALRDVTDYPGIDVAKTPEELKAAWPSILSIK